MRIFKNIKLKTISYTVAFLTLTLIAIQSCIEKDDIERYECTTYLGTAVWSNKIIHDCSNCFAPKGYTVSCIRIEE